GETSNRRRAGRGSGASLTLTPGRTPCPTTSPIPGAKPSGTRSTRRRRNTRGDQGMKYFTPELYQQFNSFGVDEAERADEAWDRAEAAYKERLASIRNHMPSPVVKLSELCLHDALVVSRVEQAQPNGPYSFQLPS